MKKTIITFLLLINGLIIPNANAISIKNTLINDTNSSLSSINNTDGLTMMARLFAWVKDEVMTMVWVLAIGVFIFIGFKIVLARGNPEEFKKAIMYFVYAVIGIFIIFIAWGIVSLVSSLSLK